MEAVCTLMNDDRVIAGRGFLTQAGLSAGGDELNEGDDDDNSRNRLVVDAV